jgi:hypothetical protein
VNQPSAGDSNAGGRPESSEYSPGLYLGTWAAGAAKVVIADSLHDAATALHQKGGAPPDHVGLLESHMDL